MKSFLAFILVSALSLQAFGLSCDVLLGNKLGNLGDLAANAITSADARNPYYASFPILFGGHTSGIDPVRLEILSSPRSYGRQRSDNWCWAAGLQMLINFSGLGISQESIVANLYGRLVDWAANLEQIVQTLHQLTFISNDGSSIIKLDPASVPPRFIDILFKLDENVPLLAPLQLNPAIGHAVVVERVSYDIDPLSGAVIPRTVTFRDPGAEGESQRTVSWNWFLAKLGSSPLIVIQPYKAMT